MQERWSNQIKHSLCKLGATLALFLLVWVVPAALEGALSPAAAVLLFLGALFGLNAVCGVLLAAPAKAKAPQARPAAAEAPARREVPLRVVRGGRAA